MALQNKFVKEIFITTTYIILNSWKVVCRTVCVGVLNKLSSHRGTHSMTTARIIAEPIRSLHRLMTKQTPIVQILSV